MIATFVAVVMFVMALWVLTALAYISPFTATWLLLVLGVGVGWYVIAYLQRDR